MKQKELTKTFMMVSNLKKTFVEKQTLYKDYTEDSNVSHSITVGDLFLPKPKKIIFLSHHSITSLKTSLLIRD